MNVIPLFKSHYSFRSILTLEGKGETAKLATESKRDPLLAADSIIDIAAENDLKHVFLVEDGMSAFLEAEMNCRKAGLSLNFGLRLTQTKALSVKDDASRRTDSKIVIFARNTAGYKRLIKIFTLAATEGFYYEPRIDVGGLEKHWNEDDLLLAIPFYDSFLYYNTLTFRTIIPEFAGKPTFLVEDNGMVFDQSIKLAIEKFDPDSEHARVQAKSIFYKTRADFRAYQTYRCIRNRSTLSKPQLDHFSSDEFCFEAWKEQNALPAL